jgi:septal ring factor EnvC (AmiA/AmiB activator)
MMGSLTLNLLAAGVDVNKTVIPVLIALISSGFIFGLVKVLPERRSILVQASENAVKVVNDAIGTLQKELAESRAEIIRLEAELKVSTSNRMLLEDQLDALKYKVAKLEAELTIYGRLSGRELSVEERRHIEEEARRSPRSNG